jgi:hypothetical protein
VVCGGIHMSDIPSFPYSPLWEERHVLSVANLTRADAREFLAIAPQASIKMQITRYPLDRANEALADLREGARAAGRRQDGGDALSAQRGERGAGRPARGTAAGRRGAVAVNSAQNWSRARSLIKVKRGPCRYVYLFAGNLQIPGGSLINLTSLGRRSSRRGFFRCHRDGHLLQARSPLLLQRPKFGRRRPMVRGVLVGRRDPKQHRLAERHRQEIDSDR